MRERFCGVTCAFHGANEERDVIGGERKNDGMAEIVRGYGLPSAGAALCRFVLEVSRGAAKTGRAGAFLV